MNLHVDHEQGDDPMVIIMSNDAGEKRWYDVMVLSNMLKDGGTVEEVWAAGATENDMFELNTLINLWRNR